MDYLLLCVVRNPALRLEHAKKSVHHRPEVRVGPDQIRILDSRPRPVTEQFLLANLKEIRAYVDDHRLRVLTMAREEVNLDTMEATPLTPESPPPRSAPALLGAVFEGNDFPRYPLGAEVPSDVLPPVKLQPNRAPQPPKPAPKAPPPDITPELEAAPPPPPSEPPETLPAPPEPETVVPDVPQASPSPTFTPAPEPLTSPGIPAAKWGSKKGGKK